jgi:hypothetical protein
MTDAGQDSRTSDGTRGPAQTPAKFAHIVSRRGRRCTQGRRGGAAQDGGRLANATSPPLSENATSAPTFADVARLVAGTDAPPPWLAAQFERWAPSLMLDRCIEDKQPKKSEMKKRLAEVRKAALLLRS